MMKCVVVVLVLIIICVSGTNAQGIFNQKGSQLRRLAEQNAALEVYKGYVKTGYNIINGCVHTIRDIKNGDFGLHHEFFTALKRVNPKIKRYTKVAEIIALQLKLVRSCGQHLKAVRQSGALTEEELLYIGRVFSRLLEAGAAMLDELITLTTDGCIELKDDQRLERIDGLYGETLQQYTFLKSFNSETMQLAFARKEEYGNIEKLKAIQGILIKHSVNAQVSAISER